MMKKKQKGNEKRSFECFARMSMRNSRHVSQKKWTYTALYVNAV